jgi:beta-galactosidase
MNARGSRHLWCRLVVCLSAAALASLLVASHAVAAERAVLNFNADWRFIKADPAGAESLGFDDRGWAIVSTPHTYNDTDTFDNWSTPGHRGEQIQWSGRTWYRKAFLLPAAYRGKRVFIEFEGARQIAEVYLNGHRLGVSKTGFTPFGFDLTPYLSFGPAVNLLAVMCDNRFMKDPIDQATAAAMGTATTGGKPAPNPNLAQLSAKVNESIPDDLDQLAADQIPWNNPHWHPAHGGIYRNVRLVVTDPLHITLPLYSFLKSVGPYVYSTAVTREAAAVTVEIPVENGRTTRESVDVRADVFDADGRSVLVLTGADTIDAGASRQFALSGSVPRPRLWEPAYPHVYRVVCSVRVNGATVDTAEVPLGVRTVRWDAQQGLILNGERLTLRGWGQKPTNEWPGLGAALPDWLHAYTLQLMKEAGGNFVRWGHTAAGPAMIAASDRLGLITDQPGVDGESDTRGAAWTLRASALRDVIIYFRNNPSILIWEGGNQKVSREHAAQLRQLMDTYDPKGGRAYAHRRADQITAEFMDVGIGTEGGREIARLPVVEGEYNREESPRRVWDAATPPSFGYPEALGQTYQLTSEQFAVNQVAQYVRKLGAPEHSGGANWIFSDSTSGGRVAVEVVRASGEVDAARLPKEAYYVCAVMFRDEPGVHIIGHWTYPAGTKKTIYVASNAEQVELFVNGRSVGQGARSDRYLFAFADVAWEKGEIKAVASSQGRPVATQVKRTAGPAVALKLTPMVGPDGLRADGADILLLDVEAVDARGDRVPTFEQRVDFEVAGPGVWRGGYNSGRINSTNNTYLNLEAGINRVAIRAGTMASAIAVHARSEGLKAATATVTSHAVITDGGITPVLPAAATGSLPAKPPERLVGALAAPVRDLKPTPATVNRFIRSFNYSGPSAYLVHVESRAANGKNAYVDADSPFAGLTADLVDADWVQAASRDSLYNAVDLMELAVAAGSVVSVAHDDRVPRPGWLTRQFTPTATRITVSGQLMTVFQRRVERDESLTLGANVESGTVTAANMFIVFVNRPAT